MDGKVLYFNFGDSENNFVESLVYPIENFRGFACIDATSLGMYFKPLLTSGTGNNDLIDITIMSGKHQEVIRDVWNLMKTSGDFLTIYNGDITTASNNQTNRASKYIITCEHGYSAGVYCHTQNITGTGEVTLFDGYTQWDSILLASVHASNAATVDLYFDLTADGTNDYIIKGTAIPLGATLKLDGSDLNYDQNKYKLYIKLGAGSIDATGRKYHHPEQYYD